MNEIRIQFSKGSFIEVLICYAAFQCLNLFGIIFGVVVAALCYSDVAGYGINTRHFISVVRFNWLLLPFVAYMSCNHICVRGKVSGTKKLITYPFFFPFFLSARYSMHILMTMGLFSCR